MSTHEYWQFAFVKELGADVDVAVLLGYRAPLRVELSSLPTGSVHEVETPTEVVSGDHIRVYYSIPSDVDGYTLTGNVKILRKTKEFPRSHNDSSAVVVVNEDYTATIGTLARDEYYYYVDHDTSGAKSVWYYTSFYEATDVDQNTVWLLSPVYSHDRGFALTADTTEHGERLFNYFPQGIRMKDKSEAEDTLYRLSKIMGKAFDEIKERLDQFRDKRHIPLEVDAALIPYIDGLLGWPTNFELSELKRRKETANAVETWKSKGTTNSFETALQTLTGWDVELHRGWRHVITTATADDVLDPNTPPVGWVEATDGVWADYVTDIPFNGTVDFSDLSKNFTVGSHEFDFKVINDGGSWLNLYGVLIRLLNPSAGVDALEEQLAKDKIVRLLDYLAIHYANFTVEVQDQ